MSSTNETREQRIARLAAELSAETESVLKIVDSVARDAQLGAEQLIAVNNAKLKLQRARLLDRAYALGEKMDTALSGDSPDFGEVLGLLLIKTLLAADITPSMESYDGVLKVLTQGAKDLGSKRRPVTAPRFGPERKQ